MKEETKSLLLEMESASDKEPSVDEFDFLSFLNEKGELTKPRKIAKLLSKVKSVYDKAYIVITSNDVDREISEGVKKQISEKSFDFQKVIDATQSKLVELGDKDLYEEVGKKLESSLKIAKGLFSQGSEQPSNKDEENPAFKFLLQKYAEIDALITETTIAPGTPQESASEFEVILSRLKNLQKTLTGIDVSLKKKFTHAIKTREEFEGDLEKSLKTAFGTAFPGGLSVRRDCSTLIKYMSSFFELGRGKISKVAPAPDVGEDSSNSNDEDSTGSDGEVGDEVEEEVDMEAIRLSKEKQRRKAFSDYKEGNLRNLDDIFFTDTYDKEAKNALKRDKKGEPSEYDSWLAATGWFAGRMRREGLLGVRPEHVLSLRNEVKGGLDVPKSLSDRNIEFLQEILKKSKELQRVSLSKDKYKILSAQTTLKLLRTASKKLNPKKKTIQNEILKGIEKISNDPEKVGREERKKLEILGMDYIFLSKIQDIRNVELKVERKRKKEGDVKTETEEKKDKITKDIRSLEKNVEGLNLEELEGNLDEDFSSHKEEIIKLQKLTDKIYSGGVKNTEDLEVKIKNIKNITSGGIKKAEELQLKIKQAFEEAEEEYRSYVDFRDMESPEKKKESQEKELKSKRKLEMRKDQLDTIENIISIYAKFDSLASFLKKEYEDVRKSLYVRSDARFLLGEAFITLREILAFYKKNSKKVQVGLAGKSVLTEEELTKVDVVYKGKGDLFNIPMPLVSITNNIEDPGQRWEGLLYKTILIEVKGDSYRFIHYPSGRELLQTRANFISRKSLDKAVETLSHAHQTNSRLWRRLLNSESVGSELRDITPDMSDKEVRSTLENLLSTEGGQRVSEFFLDLASETLNEVDDTADFWYHMFVGLDREDFSSLSSNVDILATGKEEGDEERKERHAAYRSLVGNPSERGKQLNGEAMLERFQSKFSGVMPISLREGTIEKISEDAGILLGISDFENEKTFSRALKQESKIEEVLEKRKLKKLKIDIAKINNSIKFLRSTEGQEVPEDLTKEINKLKVELSKAKVKIKNPLEAIKERYESLDEETQKNLKKQKIIRYNLISNNNFLNSVMATAKSLKEEGSEEIDFQEIADTLKVKNDKLGKKSRTSEQIQKKIENLATLGLDVYEKISRIRMGSSVEASTKQQENRAFGKNSMFSGLINFPGSGKVWVNSLKDIPSVRRMEDFFESVDLREVIGEKKRGKSGKEGRIASGLYALEVLTYLDPLEVGTQLARPSKQRMRDFTSITKSDVASEIEMANPDSFRVAESTAKFDSWRGDVLPLPFDIANAPLETFARSDEKAHKVAASVTNGAYAENVGLRNLDDKLGDVMRSGGVGPTQELNEKMSRKLFKALGLLKEEAENIQKTYEEGLSPEQIKTGNYPAVVKAISNAQNALASKTATNYFEIVPYLRDAFRRMEILEQVYKDKRSLKVLKHNIKEDIRNAILNSNSRQNFIRSVYPKLEDSDEEGIAISDEDSEYILYVLSLLSDTFNEKISSVEEALKTSLPDVSAPKSSIEMEADVNRLAQELKTWTLNPGMVKPKKTKKKRTKKAGTKKGRVPPKNPFEVDASTISSEELEKFKKQIGVKK